jgi:hypothetical protein
MRSRPVAVLVALATAVAGLSLIADREAASAPSVSPFRGLGTWVDVYDYGPRFQGDGGGVPAVLPASVDDMARLGVRTVYLQAAQDDARSEGAIVDRELVGRFLRRAHRRGMRVVAWYLPHFAELDRDLRHVRALERFRAGDERFDGIALDIEWTSDVEDVAARNRALVELAERTQELVTDVPLGAIVLEPVLIEDVNPGYWPDFPWKRLADSFDVWMPMSYWTNRSSTSGWRDGFRYTRENIRRVRERLDDPDAPVHAIGGIGDTAGADDYDGFVRASKRGRAIGWSVYDYATTISPAWPRLRGNL